MDNLKDYNWSTKYKNQIKRNIGFLKKEEQEKLRTTLIVIFGVGGIGGPLSEQLVRIGCEKLVICDNEKFEESNLNRQICTREDLGEYKVDALEKFLKKINPEIDIYKYHEINSNNISSILENASIAVLTLDDPILSILISRICLNKDIPLIESWALPYLWAWWFSKHSPTYESVYGFNTQEMGIDQIKKSTAKLLEIRKNLLTTLVQFPGIKDTFNRVEGTLDKMIKGKIPLISIAPCSRITASYLAFDIAYSGVLKIKKMNLAPYITGFDYLKMRVINLKIK